MGLAKTDLFSTTQNEIALFGKVLSNPARVAILQHLFKVESCVCGGLVEVVGLAQPTISQHLKELKNMGLIKGNVEGTSVCYCIDSENWERMRNALHSFLDKDVAADGDCC